MSFNLATSKCKGLPSGPGIQSLMTGPGGTPCIGGRGIQNSAFQ